MKMIDNITKPLFLLALLAGCGGPLSAAVMISAPPAANPLVFPNPWRSDLHQDKPITFEQMPADATLKIFTVDAKLVVSLSTGNGTVVWDRLNSAGDRVSSGLYLYLVEDASGRKIRGKFAIIR